MSWNPEQYNRFAVEREQPFWDLAALVKKPDRAAWDLVDLGCGDGRLTAALHDKLGPARTLGLDSSPAMLAGADEWARPSLRFEEGDLAAWAGPADVVFANAALQWVPDHPGVIGAWRQGLRSGGQLAVQVPTNADHPSHVVARRLGREWLGDACPPDPVEQNVLAPGAYAELLFGLGFERQHVRLQVYGHRLESSQAVVEWVKGTSLTRFRSVLAAEDFDAFVAEYRRRLVAELGARAPYFYAFKRILMWGRLP